ELTFHFLSLCNRRSLQTHQTLFPQVSCVAVYNETPT
ncbi:hypothetical protein VCHENC02_4109, partial [Vibrio harveyi]